MHVAHPVGQFVHELAPAAEKEPDAQARQSLEPPAENWLAVHWLQAPLTRPYPESQVEQLEVPVQVVQPVAQEVHEWAPANEKDPLAQAAHAAEPPAEKWLTEHLVHTPPEIP